MPLSTPPRVLIVEDDEDLRDTLAATLEDRGLDVQTAGSRAEAWALLDVAPPDLVVTDIRMRGAPEGLHLAQELRARWPNLRVVAFTGSESASPLKELGVFDEIVEKGDARLLIDTLGRLLGVAL